MADQSPIDEDEYAALYGNIGTVFTPASPINDFQLFAGRLNQISCVFDAITEVGKHIILFGERGVGKTSLANILSEKIRFPGRNILFKRVNCFQFWCPLRLVCVWLVSSHPTPSPWGSTIVIL
jgi:hypothetical protein